MRNLLFILLPYILFVTCSYSQSSDLQQKDATKTKIYYSEIQDEIVEFKGVLRNYMSKKGASSIREDNPVFKVVNDTIRKVVTNSYFRDYEFVALNKDTVRLKNIEKHIFILTTILDDKICTSCVKQLNYLNKLSREFKNDITFLMLIGKFANEIDQEIVSSIDKSIILIPKTNHINNTVVYSDFEYKLGVPKIFFLNKEKKIINNSFYILTDEDDSKNQKDVLVRNNERIKKVLFNLIKN